MILHDLTLIQIELIWSKEQRDGKRKGTERTATPRHTEARRELPQPSHENNIEPRAATRSFARTHERNEYDFSVGLTPTTSEHLYKLSNMYIQFVQSRSFSL